MNSYLIIFAIFLILLLIVLIGFLCLLGFKFIKHQNLIEQQAVVNSENKSINNEVKLNPFCVDHEEEFAVGNCSIDGQAYCEICLTRIDDMKFAKKNSDEYLNYKWTSLTMFKKQSEQNDFDDRIKKAKAELWNKNNKPLIVRGHFKINVEDDSIESFTTLMCREEDEIFMRKELNFINL